MALFPRKHTDQSSPETSAGSPAYDARIDPANAGVVAEQASRLQVQRDIHLFGHGSAAAMAFSHYWDAQPSPVAVQMMGLASARDQIEAITSRKDAQPFPGVELGHIPSFSSSPYTGPVVGHPTLGKTHHAHQIESRRASRARFGH